MKKIIRKSFLVLVLCFICCGRIWASDINDDETKNGEYVKPDVSVSTVDNRGNYSIVVSPLNLQDAESQIQVLTRNLENGNDEGVWLFTEKNSEGYYKTTDNLSNHDYVYGEYIAEVYLVNDTGEKELITQMQYEIKENQPQQNTVGLTRSSTPFSIEIATNNKEGTFIVSAKGNGSDVSAIKFAVWGSSNGQNDIKWYDAVKSEEDTYQAEVNIKNHSYEWGEYNIHAYLIDTEGNTVFIGATNTSFSTSHQVTMTELNKEYEVTINSDTLPQYIKKVRVAVWSDEKGMDDLKWYVADSHNDIYSIIIDINQFHSLGNFSAHIYAETPDGNNIYLGNEAFTTGEPKVLKMGASKISDRRGIFEVKVDEIENKELCDSIQIAVWSDKGGQDDLKWYTLRKQESNVYMTNVDISNHNYSMGTYSIHVYLRDIKGKQAFQGAITQEFKITTEGLTINQKDGKNLIELKGLDVPGEVKDIYFLTWSNENGQDDLQWYKAKGDIKSGYSAEVDLSKHKGLGAYTTHAYAKMENDQMLYIEGTSFDTPEPLIKNISITSNNKKDGKFVVQLSGVENENLIDKIEVPVWSQNNQKDIVWYTAKKESEDLYTVDVDIKNHNYNCQIYNAHVYLTDITGNRKFALGESYSMSPEYELVDVQDENGQETSYAFKISGLMVPKGVQNVSIAVWGDSNGMNDIRWYGTSKVSEGTYTCKIPITNHREFGRYNVHIYAQNAYGHNQFVTASEFSLNKTPQIASIEPTKVNGNQGLITLKVTGVMAPSGVAKVEIPMWCADNQSDVVWYTASKLSDGIYSVTMDVKDHAYLFGNYKSHVYVTMGNGVRCFAGGTETNIQPENYVFSRYVTEIQREIVALGVKGSRVQFPTWSDAYGQDDIVWYEGHNGGNGTWNALVDSRNHSSGGSYSTHVYVTDGQTTTPIGGVTYSLQKINTDLSMMQMRANMYSSSTPYLALVNRSTHKVAIFQGWQGNWNCIQYWDCADGKASTPTVEGIFKVGIRGYYFDSGASRCYWYTQFYGNYLFHSVLYNKNGTLRDGRVGVGLSHGCVRLQIENAKWIYDTIPSGTTVVVYH